MSKHEICLKRNLGFVYFQRILIKMFISSSNHPLPGLFPVLHMQQGIHGKGEKQLRKK